MKKEDIKAIVKMTEDETSKALIVIDNELKCRVRIYRKEVDDWVLASNNDTPYYSLQEAIIQCSELYQEIFHKPVKV